MKRGRFEGGGLGKKRENDSIQRQDQSPSTDRVVGHESWLGVGLKGVKPSERGVRVVMGREEEECKKEKELSRCRYTGLAAQVSGIGECGNRWAG